MPSAFDAADNPPALRTEALTVGFGDRTVQRDVSLRVPRNAIFAVMGGSGSGKSTLLRAMTGLLRPWQGRVLIGNDDVWALDDRRRAAIGRRLGVLFQNGALWSSLSVAENVALPLKLFTRHPAAAIADLVQLKLALVGLGDAGRLMPSELSGGMRKRAGLARALALDPEILFLDEPSAGLDPVTSRRLDDLILELRDGLGATIVLVSHELPSLFAVADDGVFLDAGARTAIAHGSPARLRDSCPHPTVQLFMRRGRPGEAEGEAGDGS
jgi:phospholipid/cholesterol/gamma-HCH transport system ATP-binding protein